MLFVNAFATHFVNFHTPANVRYGQDHAPGAANLLSYLIGRYAGDHYLKRHLQKGMDRLEHWFERVGKWALAFGYFIPGVRHLTAIGAGSSGFPFGEFARYAYGGALLWTFLFFGIGYFIGLIAAAILAYGCYLLYSADKGTGMPFMRR